MNQLKVGDVVYLKSEEKLRMIISEISGDEIECIYFHPTEKNIVRTIPMPQEAVVKVEQYNSNLWDHISV